jgi:hypothetical protein
MRRSIVWLGAALLLAAVAPTPAGAEDDPAALRKQVEDLKRRVRELEALVAKLGGTVPGAPAAAGSEPASARTAVLKTRVAAWFDARKALARENCPTCRGWGVVSTRSAVRDACPKCDGRKTVIPTRAFRAVHYDMKSEAWRRRPNATDEANAAYRAADASGATPLLLSTYRIDRVELVGTRFARAWVFEGTDSVSRESRWVLSPDSASKKDVWFLFGEETDGPWEEGPAAPAAAPSSPLSPAEHEALRGRVALVETRLGLEGASREGGTLVLRFHDPKASDERLFDLAVESSAFALARAAAKAVPAASDLRLVFLARWRDKFGGVEARPYRTFTISSETLSRAVPENLTQAEVVALFSPRREVHADAILWWRP